MKTQPSQDSLKKLQAQTAAEEQKLQHLQASTKAAQGQWEDQREQIVSDTETTIEAARLAIEKATKDAKKTLAALHVQIKEAGEAYTKQRTEQGQATAKVEAELTELEHTKKVLQAANTDLREQNLTLTSEITVSQELLTDLTTKENDTSLRISGLSAKKVDLEDELHILNDKISLKNDELDALITDFDTKQGNYTRAISVLEQKKQDLMQEIISNKENDEKVRDNLAKWAKTLEEKDKNLRVREAQVDQKEKAIARNYNLLNM